MKEERSLQNYSKALAKSLFSTYKILQKDGRFILDLSSVNVSDDLRFEVCYNILKEIDQRTPNNIGTPEGELVEGAVGLAKKRGTFSIYIDTRVNAIKIDEYKTK